jgi:hypothetical protein
MRQKKMDTSDLAVVRLLPDDSPQHHETALAAARLNGALHVCLTECEPRPAAARVDWTDGLSHVIMSGVVDGGSLWLSSMADEEPCGVLLRILTNSCTDIIQLDCIRSVLGSLGVLELGCRCKQLPSIALVCLTLGPMCNLGALYLRRGVSPGGTCMYAMRPVRNVGLHLDSIGDEAVVGLLVALHPAEVRCWGKATPCQLKGLARLLPDSVERFGMSLEGVDQVIVLRALITKPGIRSVWLDLTSLGAGELRTLDISRHLPRDVPTARSCAVRFLRGENAEDVAELVVNWDGSNVGQPAYTIRTLSLSELNTPMIPRGFDQPFSPRMDGAGSASHFGYNRTESSGWTTSSEASEALSTDTMSTESGSTSTVTVPMRHLKTVSIGPTTVPMLPETAANDASEASEALSTDGMSTESGSTSTVTVPMRHLKTGSIGTTTVPMLPETAANDAKIEPMDMGTKGYDPTRKKSW